MTEAGTGATHQGLQREVGRGEEGSQREQSAEGTLPLHFQFPELRQSTSVAFSPQSVWNSVTAASGSSHHHLCILENWHSEWQPPAEPQEAPLCEVAPRGWARVPVSGPTEWGCRGLKPRLKTRPRASKPRREGPDCEAFAAREGPPAGWGTGRSGS